MHDSGLSLEELEQCASDYTVGIGQPGCVYDDCQRFTSLEQARDYVADYLRQLRSDAEGVADKPTIDVLIPGECWVVDGLYMELTRVGGLL